ncbi:MAG: AraC family transcriptional regulator [Deltaproteobacteria bacterium]|nr:AraC family transcriptional regulator [Deltaproteobacteria bacterium]
MRSVELDAFTCDALDVYVRQGHFVYVVTASGLHATLVCGAIDESAARALCTVWAATFGAAPHASLLDVSALVSADGSAFAIVQRFLAGARANIGTDVARQGIVCGPNLGAAVVLGFYTMFPPPFPIQTFERRADALAWLGDPAAGEVIGRVVREVGLGGDACLAGLRELLDREPLHQISLATAAKCLGIEPRTLQRRLAISGTDFSGELRRARVARAQRLMLDREENLTAIALEVGCSSPSTFSDLFRRITGETPTAWRYRHRVSPSDGGGSSERAPKPVFRL